MRDDIEFNIKLCEEVCRNPSLYDDTRPDYCFDLDRVWRNIAHKFNESVADCKDRWKNIRGRYGKYKNAQLRKGRKPVKEYYLAEHLQFLDEFLRPRKPKGSFPEAGSPIFEPMQDSDGEYENGEDDTITSPEISKNQPLEDVIELKHQVSRVNDSRKRKATTALENEHENICTSCGNKPELTHENESDEADMAFLRSVLPDMKAMNLRQKRKFKIAILNFAEQILEPRIHEGGSSKVT